jgi:tetratricopeptide (TPR) repeat protein
LRLLFVLIFFCVPQLLSSREIKDPSVPVVKQPSLSPEDVKLKSLYSSLDPLSITQHLAFYELYPESKYGKEAVRKAWLLLNGGKDFEGAANLPFPHLDLQAIVSLVTRQPYDESPQLNAEQLELIENLGKTLSNRKLKGHAVWSEKEVLELPSEEIDLSRALLLAQFDEKKDSKVSIRQYEASMDLMALQIRARLSKNPTAEEKIREISRYIFQEMQFRFPPHSLYAKDIDLYTFLPSVIDSRQGVCLGVSILYLCLAQRLDLNLEIVTPPGHIFLRYPQGDKALNIETTARGIHLPDETYLGINTRHLEKRTLKEVIGMAFVNQASVYWGNEDYRTTVMLYEKARPYLPEDSLLKMFLGMNYLFIGKKTEGKKLLKEVSNLTFDYAVSAETIPDDFLRGKIDIEGMKAIFLPVDETRTSVQKKQKELQKILGKHPFFRAGMLQLATTFLQLGRGSEALEVLQRYHQIDSSSSIVEYYLSLVSLQRMDYLKAWDFLKQAEKLTLARSHHPKALKALRDQLRHVCPDPQN